MRLEWNLMELNGMECWSAEGWSPPITHKRKRSQQLSSSNSTLRRNSSISFLHKRKAIAGLFPWAAGSANSNQINSSFLILKEKRRLINWFEFRRYISASSTASSHQSTKYLFDFDLRLFPQHRYTYCYNIFLFPSAKQASLNERKIKVWSFILIEWS